jgi:hypothetical protein
MKIAYFLNTGRKKNLYCRISDGTERVTFSLEHTIDPKEWNAKKEEKESENIYYFTLSDFKKYLTRRYFQLNTEGKENILTILKNEASDFLDGSGIEGIARNMFNIINEKNGLPKYDEYLQAFEKYSNLKKGDYEVETVGKVIHFHTKDQVYEMNNYTGKTAELKSFIERRSYSEIYTQTSEGIWSDIYVDAGIEKHKFLPIMISEWETYWDTTYQRIKENIGKTDHLDKMKERSWREFQVYMECYGDSGNAIQLAYEIDDSDLFPIAVITMMNIFDAETCYGEYCELEFDSSGEWDSIFLNDDDDSSVFYIKPYDI